MNKTCADFGPLRDAFVDGQIGEADAEKLRRHMEDCLECRRDIRERAVLQRALRRVELPPPPPYLEERIGATLDRADRRRVVVRFARWSVASAAGLAALLLFMIVIPTAGADVPPIVRDSSDFHDRVVSGAVQPVSFSDTGALRDYLRKQTGADVAVPMLGCGCGCGGGCAMPGHNAPCIVYRHGSTAISFLSVPDGGGPLPDQARRSRDGCDYYAFRRGKNTVILCRAGKVDHVWIARMSEGELVETALAAEAGGQALPGRRLSMRGVSCRACSATVEERAKAVPGVTDARMDMATLQLVVEGGKELDLDQVVKALREAGYYASPGR